MHWCNWWSFHNRKCLRWSWQKQSQWCVQPKLIIYCDFIRAKSFSMGIIMVGLCLWNYGFVLVGKKATIQCEKNIKWIKSLIITETSLPTSINLLNNNLNNVVFWTRLLNKNHTSWFNPISKRHSYEPSLMQ
jgi:hypothetical protein